MTWTWRANLASLGAVTLAIAAACTAAKRAPLGASAPSPPGASSSPPGPATSASLVVPTRREDTSYLMHGVRVPDPYRWLEQGSSEEVREWTGTQNRYTRSVLDRIPNRERLRSSIEKLVSVGKISAPRAVRLRSGKFRYFYLKREGTQNHPVLLMRDGVDGEDRVVVDVNGLAPNDTVALDWFFPSRDGRLLAYGLSRDGNEESTLRVREVNRAGGGRDLGTAIAGTQHCSLAWKPDGSGFYYTRYPRQGQVKKGEEHYHRGVYEHVLGTLSTNDPKWFGDGRNMTDSPSVDLSPNGRWMLIHVHQGWAKSELYLRDLRDPNATFVPVAVGKKATYYASVLNDRIIMLTNEDASRGRLVAVDPMHPTRDRWSEIVGEHADTLDDFAIAGKEIFAVYLRDASSRVVRFSRSGRRIGEVTFPMLGSASVMGEWNGAEAFVAFRSFMVPTDVYRVPLRGKARGQAKVWQRVRGVLDPGAFRIERYRAQSKDGSRIPYFVVRSTQGGGGPRPALLTGYGGFNIPVLPAFVGAAGSFVEHGGVFVSANLRGGGEFGEAWHAAGMLERKQNTFDDMIAVAEDVCRRGIAIPDRMGIIGGSNGGLLVGAMITQRPALFRVAVARVPLMDMLRYQDFLIAKLWVPEYGSADDPTMFPVLRAYSPYHNVRDRTRYPAVLLTAAQSDGRVDAFHARKMAAALQFATSSKEPVLLRIEGQAGHGAGKPLDKQLEEYVDMYGFILWKLGMLSISDDGEAVER